MANEPKGISPTEKSQRQPPPATVDEDMSEQDQRDMSQSQSQSQRQSERSNRNQDRDTNPDRVEIGDPVPEDNRTIKARGAGETGEDEDLPADDGRRETPSERH